MPSRIIRIIALILSISMTNLALSQSAFAAVISTGEALDSLSRTEQLSDIQLLLARADVQALLESHGVSAEDALNRVAALSDDELQALHAQFDKLPAGGIGLFEVLGITFLVLLILELTGTINVFSKF